VHIKYRPKTWEQIIGNIAVKKAMHFYEYRFESCLLLYTKKGNK